jgi:hypothetical protein
MGMSHSTYFAYGVNIPFTDPDSLEDALADGETAGFPEVGHLQAGDYDRDKTFLVTECTEIELGTFARVAAFRVDDAQLADWDAQLRAAAVVVGITGHLKPEWLVVPDCS